jgi:hypothetical protein
MSQCFFWRRFVAFLYKINLCAQKNHQISTEVTGQYLNTVTRFDIIFPGNCKPYPCNYFFTAAIALYYGFLCGMLHNFYMHYADILQEQTAFHLVFSHNIHDFNQGQAKCFSSVLIDYSIVLKCAAQFYWQIHSKLVGLTQYHWS